jgi:drug/metabolite transporter (DMT)-like permease
VTGERKDRIDLAGAFWLVMFAGLMGINQVLVKLVNDGLAPIAQAGLRSICALVPVLLYAWWMRKRLSISDGSLLPGVLCGSLFAIEFMMMFTAFDYTSVSRATMLFYTMPFWLALAAHFLIPGERLTLLRTAGLALAITGVGWALAHNEHPATQHALFGDLLCIGGAMCWAGIALTARLTKLSKSSPEMQLVYQLAVSSVILLPVAALSGPMLSRVHAGHRRDVRISGDRCGGVRVSDVVPGVGDLSGVRHGVVRVSHASVRGGVRLAHSG